MTPLAWMLGVILPACGAEGAAGLPPPVPMDMTRIERPATPNTFLAGPADLRPAPDAVVEPWPLPAPGLFAAAQAVIGRQPGVFVAGVFPDRLQAHYVVRSALLNYPDLVTVQALPAGETGATLVIWSRSVYGRRDFGVNKKRTEAWLAVLRQPVPRQPVPR